MIASSIPLIVEKTKKETDRAQTIFVKRKDGLPLKYKPGQFLHLGFEQMNGIVYRSYSLSSIPEEGASITVKEMENGDVSRLMQKVQIGDTLSLINVAGKFVLPTRMENIIQVFLFAAGSGITPVFSIIKNLLLHFSEIKVYLAYSNSSKQSALFLDQLNALSEAYKERFTLNLIFSNAQEILKARLSPFRLQAIIAEQRKVEWEHVLAYACGPVTYMDNIKITLFTEGILAQNFFMEYFETASDDLIVPPPDRNAYQVSIHLEGKESTIKVQYPDTILSAALDAGIALPYSCRSGQCGSCTARVTKGEVWLQYNEVLTPDELQEGLTLTCMGCPVNGDLSISYED